MSDANADLRFDVKRTAIAVERIYPRMGWVRGTEEIVAALKAWG